MAKTTIERCDHCGQKVKQPRVITVTKSMVSALGVAYRWCKKNKTNELRTGYIKNLLTHTQYCTFNDWIRISSGMVYRGNGKQVYGLNMERVEEFFAGTGTVHDVVIDPITREQKNCLPITISEVKGVAAFLDNDGIYQVEYVARPI